jgi:hypothetical protein
MLACFYRGKVLLAAFKSHRKRHVPINALVDAAFDKDISAGSVASARATDDLLGVVGIGNRNVRAAIRQNGVALRCRNGRAGRNDLDRERFLSIEENLGHGDTIRTLHVRPFAAARIRYGLNNASAINSSAGE